MAKAPENIIAIMEAGGNIIIEEPHGKVKDSLVQMAEAAVEFKVQLTIRHCESYQVETLIKVAQAGKGYVTFGV
jgi:hypothetical protein